MELSLAEKIHQAPKALLHDHLDGGLRPQTIIEIADEVGYAGLPASDAASLGTWFRESADSGSLERYLETFDHTLAVMQTAEGLRRVARECVLDLARTASSMPRAATPRSSTSRQACSSRTSSRPSMPASARARPSCRGRAPDPGHAPC